MLSTNETPLPILLVVWRPSALASTNERGVWSHRVEDRNVIVMGGGGPRPQCLFTTPFPFFGFSPLAHMSTRPATCKKPARGAKRSVQVRDDSDNRGTPIPPSSPEDPQARRALGSGENTANKSSSHPNKQIVCISL